ncbi:MAG TPA: hypothetical protein VHB45_07575 [Alloacidobacterium sp.]|nr:hypothetical protein [Alloacidobacterium sp.]
MFKKKRAVLRAIDGKHIKNLSVDEIEIYEVYASQGRVVRAVTMKKGRETIIFKQKYHPVVKPSESPMSSCALTSCDSEMLSEFGAHTPRALIERWIGHGLISPKHLHSAENLG